MAGKYQQFHVDPAALVEYSSRAGALADQVRQVAVRHLASNRSVPEDCFGDIGREVGVHSTLSAHISNLHDHVHATAGTVAELGAKVSVAHTDYHLDEQDKADRFRGLAT